MPKRINPSFIRILLHPIGGTADDDEFFRLYGYLDTNNEADTKRMLVKELLPRYEGRREEVRAKILEALHYSLSSNDFDFEQVLGTEFVGFELPYDCRKFFLWIWDLITDGSSFVPLKLDEVQLYKDDEEIFLAQFDTPPDNWKEFCPGRKQSTPPDPYPPVRNLTDKPHIVRRVNTRMETTNTGSQKECTRSGTVARIASIARRRLPFEV